MRRREFIALVGGAATTWPLVAHAQRASEVPRVGFVYPGPRAAAGPRIEAFVSGLRATGFDLPQIELLVRAGEGDPTRIDALVQDVVASNVAAIGAFGPPVLHAARSATRTVPIVALDLETDPVATGLAASLARPGGNVTGVFLDFSDFTAKWIELLVESNSKISCVAVLWDPTTGPVQMDSVQKAAHSLKLRLEVAQVRTSSDFDGAFLLASQRRADAMAILSSPLISANLQPLADLALRHRLLTITLFPDFARTGGLLAYGPNLLGMYRQVGVFAGKVLRGAKPADLPIERPAKFELVLNLKTANALGISIPPSLLLRADEVIE